LPSHFCVTTLLSVVIGPTVRHNFWGSCFPR